MFIELTPVNISSHPSCRTMDLANKTTYYLTLLLTLCCIMLFITCSSIMYMVMKCQVTCTPLDVGCEHRRGVTSKQSAASKNTDEGSNTNTSYESCGSCPSIAAPSLVLALVGAHLESSAGYVCPFATLPYPIFLTRTSRSH